MALILANQDTPKTNGAQFSCFQFNSRPSEVL